MIFVFDFHQKYLSRQLQGSPGVPPPPYHGSLRPNPHHIGDLSSIIGGHGPNLVTPPSIAYHSRNDSIGLIDRQQAPPLVDIDQSNPGVDTYHSANNVQSPLLRSILQPSTSLASNQIDRQQAPPPFSMNQSNRGTDTIDSPFIHATPTAAEVDQSLATSALIDRHRLLPPHITDQSELKFPNMGVSRSYPTEEEELDNLLQKLDDAYPVNFTYSKLCPVLYTSIIL